MKFCFLLCSMIFTFSLKASGSQEEAFWPGTEYTDIIPTLNETLGHDYGQRISAPDELITYFKALNTAAPDRSRLVTYAQSWEGRPLVYLVVSSKENIANLAQNQSDMQKLAAPKNLNQDSIDQLVKSTLPVSWLSYGVHGDEISSSDAALLAAYHLLAANNSAEVDNILQNSIVIIDPSQNPDGRSRFVEHYRQIYGLEPSVHQLSAEHLQAWPGGRTNHYLFDMNRDWFAQTQPEVQGRVQHYLKFQPVVHVDIHEMGADNSYYFPPPAEPFNPHITNAQKLNLELYGKGNARAFDQFQFDYFTREIFDAYYPGYGDTWPGFHGATAMTFEMASARGLATLRLDGRVLTYRDGVHRHFVSSIATLLTTANNREQLLRDFTEFRSTASEHKKQYVVTGGDRSLQIKMADLLNRQGVDVYQTKSKRKVCGKSVEQNTFVIPAGQPAGRLVQTLLDVENPIAKQFWNEQERRREAGLEVEFYDILAWSLPALFNLEVITCSSKISNLIAYQAESSTEEKTVKFASLAYIVPWGSQSAVRFLSQLLRANVVVHSADRPFELSGRTFGKGALIIKVKENNEYLLQTLTRLSNLTQVDVVSTNTSWTTKGINFGSSNVKRLYMPKVALAWDRPTISYAAGNTRFVIERQMELPTTPIRSRHLSEPELDDFNVLILPDSTDYKSVLRRGTQKNIIRWVKNGGTLITLGRASRFLLSNGLDLLETSLESRNKEAIEDNEEDEDSRLTTATFIESIDDYNEVIHLNDAKPDHVSGVLLRGLINQDHWMSGGVAASLNFMVKGSDVYRPLIHDTGVNLVKYADAENLVASGAIWAENKRQLAHKPAVMVSEVGRGQVIAFTSDPAFRAYMDGLNVLLANAILKGPAHTLGR